MGLKFGQSLPEQDTPIIYDINLGKIVKQSQLHKSITIYDLDQKDSYYDTTINLISRMMSFENTLSDYLY